MKNQSPKSPFPAPIYSPAKRLKNFSESVIREQTRLAHIHGAVNLAQGFPDFPCEPALKALARNAIDADFNQYSVTWGMPGLRQALAHKYQWYNGMPVDADRNITVTCGATEAMICAFLSQLDPGKEVIFFQPFYENYHPDAYLSGAKPVYVTLQEPDWSINERELKAAFNSRTAAIVINTPHNPTGKVFSRSELELIAKLCQKWGSLVFSDEIYEHILYDGAKHISPASLPGLEDRTITIGSASKTYGITGWRVGWAVAHEKLTNGLRQVHDFMTVCAASPLQEAVRGALGLPVEFYENLAQHYLKRRDFLIAGLEDAGFRCHIPRGAYYVMADVADEIEGTKIKGLASTGANKFRDDAVFARFLVEEVKVAVVPGSSFYRTKTGGLRGARRDHKLRFCFCKKEETLALALDRLKKFRQSFG